MTRIHSGLAVMMALMIGCPETAAGGTDGGHASELLNWRSWRRHDGLRGSQVWTLTQDQSGYLWLGTNEGLVRFDGMRFVSGQLLMGGELPDASVRALYVAKNGALWIGFGGAGGVSSLHDNDVRNYGPSDGLPDALITSLLEDSRGLVWAASLNGLFHLQGERWQQIDPSSGLRAQIIDNIFEDSHGTFWVGTPTGVFRRRADNMAFELVTTSQIEGFAEDSRGQVWGSGREVLMLLHGSEPRAFPQVRKHSAGRRLLHDGEGNLWIATLGDGLLRVDIRGEDPMVERISGTGTLSSDVVRALHRDREGNLWVGTQNGLDRASRGVIRSLPAAGDQMTRLTRAVATGADGSVWVGTGDGVYRFARDGRRHYGLESDLAAASVSALHGDALGRMWVATDRGVGLMRGERFVPIIAPTQLSRPIAMTTDGEGALWLSDLDQGVFRWNGRTLARVGPGTPTNPRPSFPIVTDSRGRVWAGYADGSLAMYDQGDVRVYTPADGLTGGMITSLHEDRSGTLWIGATSGLTRFRDGRFASATWASGLPGNVVGAITSDEEGVLWLGVSSGIVRLDPRDFDGWLGEPDDLLPLMLYDASDGLRGDPIGLGHPTVTRGAEGALWFVTSDGLAVIAPGQTARNRIPPPVLIESVTADQKPAMLGQHVRLPPLTGSLQIDYVSLTLTAPEKIRFRYLLEGFDREWVDAGTRRQAFYTNLPPARYRFRVIADSDGIPSDHEAVWEFTLTPAFYQTRWFAAALGLLAIAGVAAAWRTRVHQVRGRFSSILVERTRMAREIHDTLLQSLLGVLFQLDEVASTIDASKETAKEQLRRLRRQVEFYVREARYSIKDLRSPILQSRDLASALREAGETLTAPNQIRFECIVTGKPYRAAQRVEEHLLRIGQEAIANAVQHSRGCVVRVELCFRQNAIVLRVTDDGIGFDENIAPGRDDNHWGLTSMRERAEQIAAIFKLDSRPGVGAIIEVTAPVSHSEPS